MKGFKKRSLTKNYELNIIESSNDMNPKDDSFLSGSKGSFSPPGENLSSGSISILNKKLRVRKDKDIKIDKASFVSYKTNNISKDYTLGKTLGQGSFGTVRKAVHKATKQERAIKILKKSAQDEEKFFLEVNILSKLTHPNIMHIYEFYEDKANYYIVSELCKGGELFDMITEKGAFNEAEACPLMHQLMSAICYCHQNRVVHRDLK